MLELGLSTCGFKPNEKNFEALASAGIKNAEISVAFEEYPNLNHEEIKNAADKTGIKLWSYHLPFSNAKTFDIASLDEEMRINTIKSLVEYIKLGADIGIDKFVLHPCGEPKSSEGDVREEEICRSMQSLDYLAEIAAHEGAVIAVEDLPRSCLANTSDELLRLISANDKLRVCFDTNHLLTENPVDFINKLGDKIITTHVSDFDFINERHWLPGEGKLDWQALYSALIEKGYRGPWLYEISLVPNPKTMDRRTLEFSDFYNNAMEIFEGKQPTPIGSPKENLGMWGVK